MDSSRHDASQQFVVDHRKLVVGFALLMILCGSFYVIGYMEGKRQGRTNPGSPAASAEEGEPARKEMARVAPLRAEGGSEAGKSEVPPPLDWYQGVQREGAQAPGGAGTPAAPAGTKEPEPGSARPAASKPKPASSKVTYSVQVGAFRNKAEAETKAGQLKARKYPCTIEPPGTSGHLYLLKVGRYESRAEAVAMQLRLKRDGYTTFIKANR